MFPLKLEMSGVRLLLDKTHCFCSRTDGRTRFFGHLHAKAPKGAIIGKFNSPDSDPPEAKILSNCLQKTLISFRKTPAECVKPQNFRLRRLGINCNLKSDVLHCLHH